MPDAFDPYHVWLGIPPEAQPPNHYRLLGLPPLEDSPDAIQHAADQRMAHLRNLQTGKHAKLSQKLLNEVAAARVCLLHPEKKAAYDRQLGKGLPPKAAKPPKPPRVRPGLADQRTATYDPALAGGKPAGETTAEATALGQLGEYQLLEKLGEGGMGAVYKALHTKLDREVALKVLPKGRLEDPRAIARFEREMKAVGQLDHSNVVRAYDAREIEGTCFLVMELVAGLDLARFVRRYGPLRVADACEVIRQAALGLQSAHEHGLVHRDVKPSNLMLTHEGHVKLLDLGLARFQLDQPASEEMTTSGQAVGTIDYMAPEQITDTRTVDIRADIYSLGCTLYALLAGRAPFAGSEYEGPFDKMRAHLHDPAPSIRQFRDDVPPEVLAVLNRMLAKEADARFGTPAEVADAIGPLAAGSDLPGLLARAGHKPPPVVRRRPSQKSTEGSPSSGLTRFFQRLKAEPRRADGGPTPVEEAPWPKRAIVIGSAAVGILLVLILIVLAFRSRTTPTGASKETVLVLDWPETQREDTTVLIGRKLFHFPASGPLEVPCRPGKYRIAAERKGYRTWKGVVMADAGKRTEVPEPPWEPKEELPSRPQGHLVIQWPREERTDAVLTIDDGPQDVSRLPEPNPGCVKLTLAVGQHKVRISRFGFKPVLWTVEIAEGTSLTKIPHWEPDKLRIPPEAVQPEIVKRVDRTYGVADAETAADRLELARKMLNDAKQTNQNPDKRYVLLRRAAQLAVEGEDPKLTLEAVEAVGTDFDVDARAVRQGAFEDFVRTHPDSPTLASLAKTPDDQLILGDAYWNVAQAETDRTTQQKLRLSAETYYRRAEAKIADADTKARVAQRLEEIRNLQKQRTEKAEEAAAEKVFGENLKRAEDDVADWRFRAAAAKLAEIQIGEPEFPARLVPRFAARLARRRDEVRRMAELKARMIEKVNTARPRLKKVPMKMRGINGELVQADEDGITAELINGKTDSQPWGKLPEAVGAVKEFLQLAVDPNRPGDWLSAAVLAFTCEDVALAERLFEKARSEGVGIDPYLAPLAGAGFADARVLLRKTEELLKEGKLTDAENGFKRASGALEELEKKYARIEWFKAHKAAIAAARAAAQAGIAETEAEMLYAQAAKAFKENQLFDARPLVHRLRADYANTRPVTDPQRKPSLAEMENAVVNLGKFITVRQDGKGDFKSIQQAINAAPPNSLIEIQDNGTYDGTIVILAEKEGLTIRGRKGCWPLITTLRPTENLVTVLAPATSLQRLVLLHTSPDGEHPSVAFVGALPFHIKSTLVYIDERFYGAFLYYGGRKEFEVEDCLICANAEPRSLTVFRNSLLVGGVVGLGVPSSEFRSCTVLRVYAPAQGLLLDCVLGKIHNPRLNQYRIENCNVFGQPAPGHGKNCFSANPQFRDPNNFDFRLMPTSPCIGRASDGGDIGVRYTPEMLEMCQIAARLKQQGIIKFEFKP